jgi:hypothetical protein
MKLTTTFVSVDGAAQGIGQLKAKPGRELQVHGTDRQP